MTKQTMYEFHVLHLDVECKGRKICFSSSTFHNQFVMFLFQYVKCYEHKSNGHGMVYTRRLTYIFKEPKKDVTL